MKVPLGEPILGIIYNTHYIISFNDMVGPTQDGFCAFRLSLLFFSLLKPRVPKVLDKVHNHTVNQDLVVAEMWGLQNPFPIPRILNSN